MGNALRHFRWYALALPLIGSAPGLGSAADPPAGAGDPRRGEALYVGSAKLEHGGAPCLGCHGIAGHGLARAATFGPDLSAAVESYGVEGVADALAQMPYPSMQPVYKRHELTAQERADLVAFLGEASGKAPQGLGAGYGAGVAVAMAAFLGAFVWIGKRGTARRARASGAERGTP